MGHTQRQCSVLWMATVHTMLTNNILLLLVGLAFLPPPTLAQNLMFKEKRSVEYEGKTISLWFKIFYVMEKGEPVFTRYGKRMSRVDACYVFWPVHQKGIQNFISCVYRSTSAYRPL